MTKENQVNPKLQSTFPPLKKKKKKRFVLIMINECKPFSAGDIALLIWGMWLCYKIRNAPAAYNESKYISWAIYNAMFVTSFLMVVRFVQDYMKYIWGVLFPCNKESYITRLKLPYIVMYNPLCNESLSSLCQIPNQLEKSRAQY